MNVHFPKIEEPKIRLKIDRDFLVNIINHLVFLISNEDELQKQYSMFTDYTYTSVTKHFNIHLYNVMSSICNTSQKDTVKLTLNWLQAKHLSNVLIEAPVPDNPLKQVKYFNLIEELDKQLKTNE